jgi:hypothetical protein
VTPGDLLDEQRAPEPSAAVAARVVAARAAAAQRLRGIGWRIDADVPGPVLRTRWRLPSGITSGADLRLDRGELPPDATPQRHRFLVRNRLIAGLTAGTVVVVAGVRSGALATARQALRMGRAVMGVPGPVTSAESAGVHELIRTRPDVTLVNPHRRGGRAGGSHRRRPGAPAGGAGHDPRCPDPARPPGARRPARRRRRRTRPDRGQTCGGCSSTDGAPERAS